ncbi:MAG: shikimate kinase [Beijerinckiaceae bacterium]
MMMNVLRTGGSPAEPADAAPAPEPTAAANGGCPSIREQLGDRLVVLVGLMASGKTSVGRILAQKLGLSFVDADHEIETAAQMTIPEIFAMHGEPSFRSGERRVIQRLLRDGPRVLATGGGAFMNEETRAAIRERGVSVWLKADFDTLMRRARRRTNRPLLQTADPEATMRGLIEARYPVYAEADVTVHSVDGPHDATADAVIAAIKAHLEARGRARA